MRTSGNNYQIDGADNNDAFQAAAVSGAASRASRDAAAD